MRIAVISSTIFPVGVPTQASFSPLPACFQHAPMATYAGLEVITWHCAYGLARRGHKVLLIASDGSSCPGCEVFHTGPAGRHTEREAFGGCKDVLRYGRNYDGYWQTLLRTDVVLDHSWSKESVGLAVEGRIKPPLIVTHAPVNTMMKEPPPEGKANVVCISDDQRSHYEALFSGRKARVVKNGIDTNYYRPLGTPRTDRFLFLARFSKIKGADIAEDACIKTGAGLDLIGDTTITGEPEYLRECQRKADGKQIKIHGNQPRGACVYWYSQAHCMLHPVKHFCEPFGLAPIEAQSCQTPVISWDHGAMRETVKHGETGWLVNSESELVDAINNAKEGISDDMRKRCREWVCDSFTIEHMVSGYERLCHDVAGGVAW